jgi:CRP-like cAMP-binding protein
MISPELLRRYPYFAGVSDESLRQVAMIADEKTAAAGTILFREDDPAENLILLTSGELDIYFTLGSGELRVVDSVVAGELSMWSSLVAPYKSTALCKVSKDAKMIVINAPKLRELCDQDSALGYRLMVCLTKALASRLSAARVQLATID